MSLPVNHKKLHATAAEARETLKAKPNSYLPLEELARALHWLQDAEAPAYFRRAAAVFPLFAGDPSSSMHVANHYRLAGDADEARRHYEQAYELLRKSGMGMPDLGLLVPCCYILGKYAEAEAFADELGSRYTTRNVTTFAIARLARAQRTGDGAYATLAGQELVMLIRKQRAQPTDTGLLTYWDCYELALDAAPPGSID